ncbi:MAG: c-type cytochrome biogenesis protein CcsB [Bacteroidetes bacterium]|nr:c-type cytochrome biogenesis protein CcsB [Bacteroidota bacterium]MBU1578459.1 c-type cytochrome biogenesis protein CcsB [Bacteroidota bacterium]MBU2558967.1 c-type cytochrome biogenesis protein CcsB [Bacteroidota bacterium]
MKKVLSILFSMELMGLMVMAFAVAIGVATFVENDFGTVGAKAVVYNATWFEILLVLLAINLVANIFKYKMYRKQKLVVFTFHLSFIIILIGAGITRFIGFEGIMSIREGQTESTMLSDNTYVMTELIDGEQKVYTDEAVLMSALSEKSYSDKASINGKSFRFKSVRYVPNAQEMLVKGQAGEGAPYVIMVVSTANSGRNNLIIKKGDQRRFLGQNFLFDQKDTPGAIQLSYENGELKIKTPEVLTAMSMAGGDSDTLAANQWQAFEMRKLYSMGDMRIVLTDIYENGKVDFSAYRGNDMNFMDAMIVEVESGGQTKEIALRGGKGYLGETAKFELNGTTVNMMYGAKMIDLPFAIKLVDFQLERYPGSNSPASYASEVILIDDEDNLEKPYRIFMNNVLNYKGYRFFQSSYDKDELGTVLSVNHDALGTWVTYLGYFLLSLGMLLALFVPHTRFAFLGKLLKKSQQKTAVITLVALLAGGGLMAQQHSHSMEPTVIPEEQAAAFGALLVQDQDGRLKPLNTLSSEMLRKVARKSSFNGLNPDQVLMGMQLEPEKWQLQKMIKVSHPELKKFLNIRSGSHAAFADFLDMQSGSGYKLRDMVSQAYAKKPAERSKFDNDVIKVDERVNISYLVYTGDLLKILPDPRDSHNPWFKPGQKVSGMNANDSAFITDVIPYYFMALGAGNYQQATELVEGIHNFQQRYGAEIVPSQAKVKAEILYNKLGIFDRLGKYFGLVGLVLLVLVFVQIFKERRWINKSVSVFYWIVVVFFIFQTLGLAIRWYISGRAPWSNGYESMIYISWVTVMAGLIFSRKSPMTIAATSILASIILMVAHLSWMDPEITNLVPVLKSYWLTIHVSIITASYGFLALGALLGFINLILMILKTKKNFGDLQKRIKDLNYINERTVIIGLYLLTIGTFLGGIWANESWGRYWGWDPKETWALVTILVYTFIVHTGYIPGMKTDYNFSLFTLVGFGAVIMTYFGVNYYLSGLHSYAAGDPVPVPTFVYYTIAIIFSVSLWAYLNERKYLFAPDNK